MGSRLNPSSNIYMPMQRGYYLPNMGQMQHPLFNYQYPPNSFAHLQQQQQQQNQQIHHQHPNLQQQLNNSGLNSGINNLIGTNSSLGMMSSNFINNNINVSSNIINSINSNSSKDFGSSSGSSNLSNKEKEKEKEKDKDKEQSNIPKTNTPYTLFDNKNLELATRYFSECQTKEFTGIKKKVNSIAWNCDGTRLACGSVDGIVKVWSFDINSSSSSNRIKDKEIELKGHEASVEKLNWNPKNPDILATASLDKTIRVWDVKNGKCLSTVSTSGENIDIRWYPDGSYILSCTKDDHVSLIDAHTHKVLKNYKFNGEELNEVAWDNSGQLLFMSNGAFNIEVYKFTARSSTVKQEVVKHLKTLGGHTNVVNCLDFDPTGRYFAAGSADSIVSLWDIEDMMCIKTFTKLSFPCRSVSFSFDGQFIAASSDESIIDISHVESGQSIFSIETSSVTSLKWHPTLPILAYTPEINENNKDTCIKVFGFHS